MGAVLQHFRLRGLLRVSVRSLHNLPCFRVQAMMQCSLPQMHRSTRFADFQYFPLRVRQGYSRRTGLSFGCLACAATPYYTASLHNSHTQRKVLRLDRTHARLLRWSHPRRTLYGTQQFVQALQTDNSKGIICMAIFSYSCHNHCRDS